MKKVFKSVNIWQRYKQKRDRLEHFARLDNTMLKYEANVMRTTKLVATATSLERSTINFRSFIYSQISTNPANFVKIGHVDVEIIGLTKITEIF